MQLAETCEAVHIHRMSSGPRISARTDSTLSNDIDSEAKKLGISRTAFINAAVRLVVEYVKAKRSLPQSFLDAQEEGQNEPKPDPASAGKRRK